jgi:diguanylate cyclase (GGDEF)-like protein
MDPPLYNRGTGSAAGRKGRPLSAGRIRISLQAKILAAVLLCVTLPIGLMGGYLLQRNEEVLQQKARETLSNHLFRKATQVDEWMDQRLRDVQRWSASFIVYEGVESLSRPGADPARVQLDLRDYLESVMGHYRAYESLFVVDLQGRVVAGTSDEGLERWGQELLAGTPLRGPVVSPLHRSERLNRPTLLILQDIQGRAGHVIGYFVARVDLREVETLLRAGAEVDPSPDFWLLDGRGRILLRAGSLVERPGEEAFSAPLPAPASAPAATVGEARLPQLGPSVYGIQPLRGALEGSLAATVAVSAAYKPLDEARTRLLKIALPALLLLLAGTFLVARRLLRPIERLSEGAARVATGDLDVHLPVQGNDELTDLTRAFNEMARRIREGRASLEEVHDDLTRANEDLEKSNRQLEELARTDGLTGLFNRRHFQQRLDSIMEKSAAEDQPFSLLLFDLDHFKQYNDRWGHTEGDAELRRVAAQVLRAVRSTDEAFRYGGEELAVLLPACPKEQAVRVAEKIRATVAAGPQKQGRFGVRTTTTVSIGVATFPEDGRVARGLVDTADAALYEAKAAGRDRVVAAPGPSSKSKPVAG